jgi:hypothetical protein
MQLLVLFPEALDILQTGLTTLTARGSEWRN